MQLGPDIVPVVCSAIGVGIGLAWAIVGGGRDRARESLTHQITLLQSMLEAKDREWRAAVEFKDHEREKIRAAKIELEKANEHLSVRIARLEAERGGGQPAGPA